MFSRKVAWVYLLWVSVALCSNQYLPRVTSYSNTTSTNLESASSTSISTGCTSMGSCQPTGGYGLLPFAHIPVNSLTAAVSSTTTISGNYPAGASSSQPSDPGAQSHYTSESGTISPSPKSEPPPPSTENYIPTSEQETTYSSSAFVIGGQTMTPGGSAATISGTKYSIPSSGVVIIANGQTSVLPVYSSGPLETIVVVSSTYKTDSASAFIIGGQTLTEGGVITASGETISLAPGGSSAIIVSGTSTKVEGVGGIIASIGGFATASPTYVQASDAGCLKVLRVRMIGLFGITCVALSYTQ